MQKTCYFAQSKLLWDSSLHIKLLEFLYAFKHIYERIIFYLQSSSLSLYYQTFQ